VAACFLREFYARRAARSALSLSADTAFQIACTRILFGIGIACGNTETPFVMNRKIGRPARALKMACAGGLDQSTAHLAERSLRIGLAKCGICRMRHGQIQEKYRQDTCNSAHRSVRHVAFPKVPLSKMFPLAVLRPQRDHWQRKTNRTLNIGNLPSPPRSHVSESRLAVVWCRRRTLSGWSR
jgi:hypothetical protein